ncbi:hypothetical protein KZ829_17830 [Actinoplanes hulinensis]|uniref:Hsp70 protein n=1 Tax=Actinoplanes hulinensis TaxID=1144547 RepID=A0ABS7B483_9ACTN|nr:hypothetical protein [Actinoplanes hulinensis]MBW6435604.1 hypothetical protein [Actinoplanes hulinensis]
MAATDLHLVVDIGAWWITAVFESAGTIQPLVVDGRGRSPSGVFQDGGAFTAGTAALTAGAFRPDGYRPDPMTLLRHGGTSDPSFDPVTAVAAVLAHVADHAAGRITALTVVTAQAWGQPALQRLSRAAATACLPRPRVTTAGAALAALAGTRIALVALTGTAWPELSVLATADDGYRQLAAAPVRAPGAPAVDEALLRIAAARAGFEADPDDWRLTREVEQTRALLAVQPRAPMLLPEPHQAVVLSRDDLAIAVAAHVDRLPEVIKQVLADAEVTPAEVGAVVLAGAETGLATALRGAGLPAPITVTDPHAAVRGAAQAPRRPWWRR